MSGKTPEAPPRKSFNELLDELSTDRQRQFCREYLKDLIGCRAAIRAGYSKNSAYDQAHQNLRKPKIRAAIKQGLDELAEDCNISQAWVIEGLKQAHKRAIRNKNDHAAIRALQILAKSLGMLDKDLNVNVNQTVSAQSILYFPDNGRGPKPKGDPNEQQQREPRFKRRKSK